MDIEKISKCVFVTTIILFSLAGALFVSVGLHEYSHKQDFKSVAKGGEICLLSYPDNKTNLFNAPLGYYSFYNNKSSEQDYQSIAKYTEIKAYFITILVMAIWMVAMIGVMNHYLFKEELR